MDSTPTHKKKLIIQPARWCMAPKQYYKEYRAKNLEKMNAKQALYEKKNKLKLNEARKNNYRKKKEKEGIKVRKYEKKKEKNAIKVKGSIKSGRWVGLKPGTPEFSKANLDYYYKKVTPSVKCLCGGSFTNITKKRHHVSKRHIKFEDKCLWEI